MASYNKGATGHPVEWMYRKLSRTTLALLLAVTMLGSLAIGGGVVAQQAPVEQTQETPTQETSFLRVVHASPNAPAVDIYLNETPEPEEDMLPSEAADTASEMANVSDENETMLTNMTLTDVSFSTISDYLTIEAGSYDVMITAAGDKEAVVYEDTVTFEPRTVTTLAASGEISEPVEEEEDVFDETTTEEEEDVFDETTTEEEEDVFDETTTEEEEDVFDETTTEEEEEPGEAPEEEAEMTESSFEPVLYDDNALTPGENDSAIRIVHLSPDAPTVDVTTANGTVLADGLSFQDSSDYMTVPEGDYEVQIRADTEDNNGTVVTSVNVSLENETAYSAMAIGYLEPMDDQSPFEVALSEDATRTVHLPMEAENETDM